MPGDPLSDPAWDAPPKPPSALDDPSWDAPTASPEPRGATISPPAAPRPMTPVEFAKGFPEQAGPIRFHPLEQRPADLEERRYLWEHGVRSQAEWNRLDPVLKDRLANNLRSERMRKARWEARGGYDPAVQEEAARQGEMGPGTMALSVLGDVAGNPQRVAKGAFEAGVLLDPAYAKDTLEQKHSAMPGFKTLGEMVAGPVGGQILEGLATAGSDPINTLAVIHGPPSTALTESEKATLPGSFERMAEEGRVARRDAGILRQNAINSLDKAEAGVKALADETAQLTKTMKEGESLYLQDKWGVLDPRQKKVAGAGPSVMTENLPITPAETGAPPFPFGPGPSRLGMVESKFAQEEAVRALPLGARVTLNGQPVEIIGHRPDGAANILHANGTKQYGVRYEELGLIEPPPGSALSNRSHYQGAPAYSGIMDTPAPPALVEAALPEVTAAVGTELAVPAAQSVANAAMIVQAATGVPAPGVMKSLGLSLLAWLRRGEKGWVGGMDFANEVVTTKGRVSNAPALGASEGAKVKSFFSPGIQQDAKAWEAVQNAVFDNLNYGTPIPDDIKAVWSDALPTLRRSLSELQEARRHLDSLDPQMLDQYPIYLKRLVREPLEERAATGLTTAESNGIGLRKQFLAQDAYIMKAKGLNPEDVEVLVNELDPKLRPIQPAAPGRSKGAIEPYSEGTLLKFPNTPEGEAGRSAFADLVEIHKKNDATFARKNIRLTPEDPIPSQGTEGATFIKDIPTLLSRTWSDLYRTEAYEDLFRKLTKMTDTSNGEPLTVKITRKQFAEGQIPDGYKVMEVANGVPTRRWGILNGYSGGQAQDFLYAVRNDVADYLNPEITRQNRFAQFIHGALDRWSINATNAPTTGLYNEFYNQALVKPINGVAPGSEAASRAKQIVLDMERTGIVPDILREPMKRGVPFPPPEEGMASIADDVDSIFADALDAKNQYYDAGGRWYDRVFGSPLAEDAKGAAAGGAGQSMLRAISEGKGPVGTLVEGAFGAAETTLLRAPAQALRKRYINSDLYTTVASYLSNLEEAGKQGLSGDAAIDWASQRTLNLTQAGQWSRVGGFSETFGGAPPGISGASRSMGRGAQKALLNRFIKFSEVDLSLRGNAVKEAIEGRGWKPLVGAAIGSAVIYGVTKGGKRAAIAAGLITEDQAKQIESQYPGVAIYPVYSADKGEWTVIGLPSRSMGAPIINTPDSTGEAITQFTGPVTGSLWDMVQLATNPDAKSIYGYPLRQVNRDGTMEMAPEAGIRDIQNQWVSPWAATGRITTAMRERMSKRQQPAEGESVPGWGDIGASVIFGPVRDVSPEVVHRAGLAEFASRRRDILEEQTRAAKKTSGIPGAMDKTAQQFEQRLRDLYEEFLKRGYSEDELR